MATTKKDKQDVKALIPIILTFFVSGMVAMVGAVSNSVQKDFGLSDTESSLLASAIYIWFLLIAVPTGYIMNKLGHKKTVLLALGLSCLSMLLPLINYSYIIMVIALCLLGIANTIMQISLNLLVSDVTPKKKMSSMLTLGQFVGQIPAMIIPILAIAAASLLGSWHWVYFLFLVISLLIMLALYRTNIKESAEKDPSSIQDLFTLLKNKMVFFCFIAIICQVGIDVGVNITGPKLLLERTNVSAESANFITSVYTIIRLAGCLLGAFLLSRFSNQKIYKISLILILLGLAPLYFISTPLLIYISIGIIGLGISNLFAIIFSQALEALPRKKNDISALMIMGLVGGAIFPPIMGIATNLLSGKQIGALIVVSLCALFMLCKYKAIKDE